MSSTFKKIIQSTAILAFSISATCMNAENFTQMSRARIDDSSLNCVVSRTRTPRGSESRVATLTVKGFSNAPAVWDPKTNGWKDINNAPLFVFGASNGSENTTGDVNILVYTSMYNAPLIANIMVGASAIGTMRDEAFSSDYELHFYSSDSSSGSDFERSIQVNNYDACKIVFDTASKNWKVKK